MHMSTLGGGGGVSKAERDLSTFVIEKFFSRTRYVAHHPVSDAVQLPHLICTRDIKIHRIYSFKLLTVLFVGFNQKGNLVIFGYTQAQ